MNQDGSLSAAEKKKRQELINNLEKAITELDEFRAEIAEEMQAYFDEKSEAWQDGDAGGSYANWIGQWEDSLETYHDTVDEALPIAP